MSAPSLCGRLPVREHLRPKPRRSVLRRGEVPPDLLGSLPQRDGRVLPRHRATRSGMGRLDNRIPWHDKALASPVEGEA